MPHIYCKFNNVFFAFWFKMNISVVLSMVFLLKIWREINSERLFGVMLFGGTIPNDEKSCDVMSSHLGACFIIRFPSIFNLIWFGLLCFALVLLDFRLLCIQIVYLLTLKMKKKLRSDF